MVINLKEKLLKEEDKKVKENTKDLKFNDVRSNITDAGSLIEEEISNEFFIFKLYSTDLYNQN